MKRSSPPLTRVTGRHAFSINMCSYSSLFSGATVTTTSSMTGCTNSRMVFSSIVTPLIFTSSLLLPNRTPRPAQVTMAETVWDLYIRLNSLLRGSFCCRLDRCSRSGGLSGFTHESTQGIQFRALVQDVARWSAEQVGVNGSHIARVHLGERRLLA